MLKNFEYQAYQIGYEYHDQTSGRKTHEEAKAESKTITVGQTSTLLNLFALYITTRLDLFGKEFVG